MLNKNVLLFYIFITQYFPFYLIVQVESQKHFEPLCLLLFFFNLNRTFFCFTQRSVLNFKMIMFQLIITI